MIVVDPEVKAVDSRVGIGGYARETPITDAEDNQLEIRLWAKNADNLNFRCSENENGGN